MANDTVVPFRQPEAFQDALTVLLREKARDLLRHAIEAEVVAFLGEHATMDAAGRREVVRNGYQPEREILTGIGAVPVKIPKVRDRAGQGRVFRSALVPRSDQPEHLVEFAQSGAPRKFKRSFSNGRGVSGGLRGGARGAQVGVSSQGRRHGGGARTACERRRSAVGAGGEGRWTQGRIASVGIRPAKAGAKARRSPSDYAGLVKRTVQLRLM